MKDKKLGKKIWTTVLPAGKKTLSIVRYKNGVVLKKNKQEILIEYEEVSPVNWALLKFSKELEEGFNKEQGE